MRERQCVHQGRRSPTWFERADTATVAQFALGDMSVCSVEVDTPILCSPFAEPGEHWWIEEGLTPERREGRRPAGYWYRDPKAPEPEARFTRGAGKIGSQVFFVPPTASAGELRPPSPQARTRRWTVVTEQPRWVAISRRL